MVIDSHVRPALFAPICQDEEALKRRLDEMNYHLMSPSDLELLKRQWALAGIERVFLLPEDCSAEAGQVAISNEDIALLVSLDPDIFVGFASVDPRNADAPQQLRHAFEELNLAGLVLNTAKLKVHPYDERVVALCEVCKRVRRPVVLNGGLSLERGALMRYARPTDMEDLFVAFPDVNFCISHFGFPWVQETAAMLIKYPNLYANTALVSFDDPVRLYHKVFKEDMGKYWVEHNLADKIMFGSDSPRIRPAKSKKGLDALGLRSDVLEKICYKNATRFLGEGA